MTILLLPAALFVAALVWSSLGRPLIFRQLRSGRAGRVIAICKFRSMTSDRDPQGRLLPDAHRITRTSGQLRRLRLDELPQILAVLSGDLALIGPRPLLVETVRQFGPVGELRGSVRPGLTGWAQVNGNTRLALEEKLALDIWYVHHRSTRLDLRILGLTLVTLWRGEQRNEDRIFEAKRWCRQHMAAVVPPAPALSGLPC